MSNIDPTVLDTLRDLLPAARFRDLVASVSSGPEPQGDWVARSRAFALFEPVRSAATFLRDSLKKRGLADDRSLDRYDLEGLIMEAIDRVVDGYGLGEVLTFDGLVADLAPFVRQMDDAEGRSSDPDFATRVATEALDLLLNRKRRKEDFIDVPNCAYVHRHLVPGTPPRSRDWPFLLLEEVTEDGRRILRARQEAVIFSVRMLDFDLEEMGEVLEALLERQLRNGRYDMARRTAEQGRRVAAGFAAEIRGLLHEARRRPLATGYARRIAPVLDRARGHIDERRKRERDLRGLADELRFERTTREVDEALAVIDRELGLCGEIYARLAETIARAPIEHEAARNRAFLNRVAPGKWREPIEEVLLPLLRGPAHGLEAVGLRVIERLAPPVQPRLIDLPRFVAAAFMPIRAPRALDLDEDEAPARRLAQPRLPLEEADARVRASLDAMPDGFWLSELIKTVGEDRNLAVALVLTVHDRLKRSATEDEGELFDIVARGPRRRTDFAEFDDLRIAPAHRNPAPAAQKPPRIAVLASEATHGI